MALSELKTVSEQLRTNDWDDLAATSEVEIESLQLADLELPWTAESLIAMESVQERMKCWALREAESELNTVSEQVLVKASAERAAESDTGIESVHVLARAMDERLALSLEKQVSVAVLVKDCEALEAESEPNTVSEHVRVLVWVREAESDE